jgi:hypothetical protein
MNIIGLTLAQGHAHGLVASPNLPNPTTQPARLLAMGTCPHRGHRGRGATVAQSSSAPRPVGRGRAPAIAEELVRQTDGGESSPMR